LTEEEGKHLFSSDHPCRKSESTQLVEHMDREERKSILKKPTNPIHQIIDQIKRSKAV
jgi:hypothetical protein